jgi:hypothetical protein
MEAGEQSRSWRVQVLVVDAVHASFAYGCEGVPSGTRRNLVQRNAITRAAPGSNDNIRTGLPDCLGIGLFARISNELAARCFD